MTRGYIKSFKMKSKVLAGFLLLAIIFVDGIVPGNGFQMDYRRGRTRNCGPNCWTTQGNPCTRLKCEEVPGKVYRRCETYVTTCYQLVKQYCCI